MSMPRLVGTPAEEDEPKDMTQEQYKPRIGESQTPYVLHPPQPQEFSQYRLNRLGARSPASFMMPTGIIAPQYPIFDQPPHTLYSIENVPYHLRAANPQGFALLQHSFPQSDPRWPEPSYPLSWSPGVSPQTLPIPTSPQKVGRRSNKCAECKKQKKVRK